MDIRQAHGLLPAERSGQAVFSGLLLRNLALDEAAEAAAREAPPHLLLPVVGNARDATDPPLARAAWAVVRRGVDVEWREAVGGCPGEQAPPRAELAACVWAGCSTAPPEVLVADCRFVVDGREAWPLARERLLESQEKTSWGGCRCTPCVPAHPTDAQSERRGVLGRWRDAYRYGARPTG